MHRSMHYLGVDVAKATLTVSLVTAERQPLTAPQTVANTADGFAKLLAYLATEGATAEDTTICVESTGAYSTPVCRFFCTRGWKVSQLHALEVRRASKAHRQKTDPADSRMIAEYGARYIDRLRPYALPQPGIEQLHTILESREMYLGHRTAMTNRLHNLTDFSTVPAIECERLRDFIALCTEEIHRCEQDLRALVREHPRLEMLWRLLLTMPGIGPITAAVILVITNGGTRLLDPRHLAGHCGIAPLRYKSGTSVHRAARSRGFGPRLMRKVLHFCSLSLTRVNQPFHHYYLRKRQEGKPGRLVLNNVANKALRIICAMMRDEVPYHVSHRSVHPDLLG
jgi:transposase